jgi:hypothetical protein
MIGQNVEGEERGKREKKRKHSWRKIAPTSTLCTAPIGRDIMKIPTTRLEEVFDSQKMPHMPTTF